MKPAPIIYTIGHSTRPLEDFTAALQSFGIRLVADIRSLPGSRKYPQYDKEALEVSLPEQGIGYRHLVRLGGRRKAAKDTPNTAWRNASFRGYADYMETALFREGMEELEDAASRNPTAFMCSEAVWWRCHRSMVSDYLKLSGWNVQHIMSAGKAKEHTYTPPANIKNGRLTYAPGP